MNNDCDSGILPDSRIHKVYFLMNQIRETGQLLNSDLKLACEGSDRLRKNGKPETLTL
jgi:hypothetical protein